MSEPTNTNGARQGCTGQSQKLGQNTKWGSRKKRNLIWPCLECKETVITGKDVRRRQMGKVSIISRLLPWHAPRQTQKYKKNTDTKWNTKWNTERYKYYYGKFLFIWRLPPWHAPRQTHGGKIQNINTKWNTNTKWKTNTNTNMKWNAKNKIIQMRKVSI